MIIILTTVQTDNMRSAINKIIFKFFLLLTTFSLFAQNDKKQDRVNDIHTIIVFFDGLRPDYITAEGMPNLYAFRLQNAYGKEHHSVFPTVTRVNASSYSTGSYPGTHGLLGNTVYFPEVDTKKGLNTGDASELNKIATATNGHLLTTISLGEILQSVGAHMMVFSSGSTGQAMMQNHTVSGGAIINPAMILPESMKEKVINDIGAIPPAGKPNTQRHKWITDALLYYGLAPDGPTVSAIWFSDPDGSAHSDGIGSPAAVQSIKDVDEQFGRIINAIREKGLTDKFNIMVSTDHGFITNVGKDDVADFLIKNGIKKDKESEDVVVAGGAIYVKDHDEQIIKKIVSLLQMQDWVGAIFTKGKKMGDMKGWINGTLSFESIHWNHSSRIADILVDENWDDRKNAVGYPGTSFSRGVAGHGGLSPYEVHIPLILAGPGFKKSFESDLPTSNVDIVPTLLYLHNIPIPVSMDGRVMYEMMVKESKQVPAVKKETITTTASTDAGSYVLKLERTVTGKYAYVNYATVTRSVKVAP
jgi:predicted AlkP superfamily pyrophosphatase or phosphodiesterase